MHSWIWLLYHKLCSWDFSGLLTKNNGIQLFWRKDLFLFCFLWFDNWALTSGPCVCYTSSLPLKPCFPLFLFSCNYSSDRVLCFLPRAGLVPWSSYLCLSVARITGMYNHDQFFWPIIRIRSALKLCHGAHRNLGGTEEPAWKVNMWGQSPKYHRSIWWIIYFQRQDSCFT